MRFKGTKGNIKVVEVKNGLAKGIYLSGENQKHFLAQIITHDRTEEENIANATLFSKAPEMLDFLQRMYDEYSMNDRITGSLLKFTIEARELIKEVNK